MNQEVINYINKQIAELNEKYNLTCDLIRSKEIEIKLIGKKIKSIHDMHDNTYDALSPKKVKLDFDSSELNSLDENKSYLESEVNALKNRRDELHNQIIYVKNLLDYNYNNKDNENNNNDKRVYEFQENDRQRIARDIHDSVVQNLSALIRKMEFASKLVKQDPARAKAEIDNSKQILKDSVSELRNIIFDLRPMALDDLGVKSAFYNMCQQFKISYEGIFEYKYLGEDIIDSTLGISLLRICKELCSNSIKYSSGNKILIELSIEDNYILLKEWDNGENFDYYSFIGHKDDNTGFGLSMLNERVNILNGTIKFINDNGSKYTIQIPLVIGGNKNVS